MNPLPLFDSYPRAPGYRDQDTSRAAALDIASDAEAVKEKVLALLSVPMTDWEIADELKLPFDYVQPRRSELKADGRVIFSGTYGKSGRSKKRVKKWVCCGK